MKMTDKTYGELCVAIDKVVSEHSLQAIFDLRINVKFAKDQFVSFCWAMFYVSKFDAKALYKAGLNDNHIETALKRILSDFD